MGFKLFFYVSHLWPLKFLHKKAHINLQNGDIVQVSSASHTRVLPRYERFDHVVEGSGVELRAIVGSPDGASGSDDEVAATDPVDAVGRCQDVSAVDDGASAE